MVADADERILAALEHDVVAGWQPWTQNGAMTYEQGMIVATAHQ
jgi:hypothetical protein